MNILLVYPNSPLDTFWSFTESLRILGKKAAFPPLGLLTVAAMLPKSWQKKLVDMNVEELTDEHIKWADYVFLGATITQKSSAHEVILRCMLLDTKIVLGGPILDIGFEHFGMVDHMVCGEAEGILSNFLSDLQGGCAKRVYEPEPGQFPDIGLSPVPLWELIDIGNYVSLSAQYSRGCPHECEYCNVWVLNGRNPRPKRPEQFIAEIQAIYDTGFRGPVFVADDNLISNRPRVKMMLPELIRWQMAREYPFRFTTEADIILADDQVLMDLMVDAGFNAVFLGLETPSKASLEGCNKMQNVKRNIPVCVERVLQSGLQVYTGLMVGFDQDPPTIFDDQIAFVQKARIPVAMAGILTVPPKSLLQKRLLKEGRLLPKTTSGNNTSIDLDFVPIMDPDVLVLGYKRVMQTIYSPKAFYERVCRFLAKYDATKKVKRKMDAGTLSAFARLIWYIGIMADWQTKLYFWKTLFVALLKNPRAFSEAMTLWAYRAHFNKVANEL